MKKWTVMLIPHDLGETHTFTMSSWSFWGVVAVLAVLTFSTAFFYERHRVIADRAAALHEINRALELENARLPETPAPSGISEEEVRAIEARLRAQYDANIAAITAKLSELYEIESKARSITGLSSRSDRPAAAPRGQGGGKGGPPGTPVALAYNRLDDTTRPPNIIYGMARPSADLILQEINLRTQSFRELVGEMEAEIDRIERMPSIWPLARRAGRISSTFGYRRDPFSYRVRLHNAVDISAPQGTQVRATAKGVVAEALRDPYLGYMVRIRHGNGYETLYAHLSKMLVKPGDAVNREDVIGLVGSTGRSTGPHLHYEVHRNGKPMDPEKYMTK